MSKNMNLIKANRAKKDEFYTQLKDIENELKYYVNFLKNKTVLCNCDNPLTSNFVRFFIKNFNNLELKKLIVSCYNNGNQKAYKGIIFSVPEKINNIKDIYNYNKNILMELKDNGSFDSDECVELLKESDIIITNPPFNLFKDFFKLLIDNNKKFIIIGNHNALTYKDVFKLFMKNEISIGYTYPKDFIVFPENNNKNIKIDENGNYVAKFGNICWFTNFILEKSNKYIILKKYYNEEYYPKYENYDVININKIEDIPCDYDKIMGVPITILDKYNSNQFEIIMLAGGSARCNTDPDILKLVKYVKNKKDKGGSGIINGKPVYARVFIRNKNLI